MGALAAGLMIVLTIGSHAVRALASGSVFVLMIRFVFVIVILVITVIVLMLIRSLIVVARELLGGGRKKLGRAGSEQRKIGCQATLWFQRLHVQLGWLALVFAILFLVRSTLKHFCFTPDLLRR